MQLLGARSRLYPVVYAKFIVNISQMCFHSALDYKPPTPTALLALILKNQQVSLS
jgi:hypothetical protein